MFRKSGVSKTVFIKKTLAYVLCTQVINIFILLQTAPENLEEELSIQKRDADGDEPEDTLTKLSLRKYQLQYWILLFYSCVLLL